MPRDKNKNWPSVVGHGGYCVTPCRRGLQGPGLCIPRWRPFWNWFDFDEPQKLKSEKGSKFLLPAPPQLLLSTPGLHLPTDPTEILGSLSSGKTDFKTNFWDIWGKTFFFLKQVKHNSNAVTVNSAHCHYVKIQLSRGCVTTGQHRDRAGSL